MDSRIETLSAIFAKTAPLLSAVRASDLTLPTPCGEYNLAAVLSHIAVWVQVFDASVNDATYDFDPATHKISQGWAEIFDSSSARIVDGLRTRGFDRPMKMTASSLPGEFVLNMLLMEYIGHGWDICRTTHQPTPYSDHEATVALAASEAILAPQYRGTGMFEAAVDVPANATPMEAFVAFLGREPYWSASV